MERTQLSLWYDKTSVQKHTSKHIQITTQFTVLIAYSTEETEESVEFSDVSSLFIFWHPLKKPKIDIIVGVMLLKRFLGRYWLCRTTFIMNEYNNSSTPIKT